MPNPNPGIREAAYWKNNITVWLLVLVWAAALTGLLAWGTVASAEQAESAPTDCVKDDNSEQAGVSTESPAVLRPRTTINSSVPFGHDFAVLRRDIEYDVTANPESLTGSPRLTVEHSRFQDARGARQLNDEDIIAWAEVRDTSRAFLHVCFVRSTSFGRPGTYVGTISITDPRVARVDVPFTVSLSYATWQYALAVWIVMLLPATVYVWLLLGSFTTTELRITAFRDWIYSRNAIIAIGTGIAVSFSFWLATYFTAEAWGGSLTDITSLFGGAFAGFVAAASGVTAAGQDKAPIAQTEARRAEDEAVATDGG
jgi:hypothetical protein